MLIAVDIGNSNIVIAVHDDEKWVESFRIYSDLKKTSDEYFVVLESLLTHAGIRKQDINRSVISSVVPNLTRSVQKNIIRLFDVQPLMVDRFIQTGLKGETIPVELGSDLLCNLAQAHHMHPHSPVMSLTSATALPSALLVRMSVIGASIAPGLLRRKRPLWYRHSFSGGVENP